MTYECGVILPNGNNFCFVFIASALFYISYRLVPATPNDRILYCVCYDRVTSACPYVSKIQIYTSYHYLCCRQCDEIKKSRILYLHLTLHLTQSGEGGVWKWMPENFHEAKIATGLKASVWIIKTWYIPRCWYEGVAFFRSIQMPLNFEMFNVVYVICGMPCAQSHFSNK